MTEPMFLDEMAVRLAQRAMPLASESALFIALEAVEALVVLHDAPRPCSTAEIAERVAIDHLEGRITTSLLTPYPPGIPLLIPGERFNRKIVDYLKFTRAFNDKFPGFATDVHGLVHEVDEATGRGAYFVD
jgi:arginine/lysine/ornithine decarboxylase